MSSHLWHQLHQIQDPVRLTLVGQTVSVKDIAANSPGISLNVRASGEFTISNNLGQLLFDLNVSNGMWWGRSGGWPTTGNAVMRFPGTYWETRIDLISGTFTTIPASSGTFVRLTATNTYLYRCNTVAGVTETGTARIQWRRWNTTTTLGQADFPLTIGTETNVAFTVGVQDIGIFGLGFITPSDGSLSPTTFRGQLVSAVLSPSISGGDFAIGIRGSLAQDFFRDVTVQTKTGATINLLTSNAIFSVGGSPTTTNWRWTSAGEIWDATTVGLNRSMTLRYLS
jgi:hypothetical protein